MSEQDPLLAPPVDPESGTKETSSLDISWHARTARGLESQRLHKAVIALIIIDSACVLADLSYTLLKNQSCTPDGRQETPDPEWLEVLAHISLAITTLFLIEIPLQLWAFGLSYYSPFTSDESVKEGKVHYGLLHLFDALVIMTTFVLEVALKGRERELAGLLVLLRLWRLVKLVGGVAVGAGELSEEGAQELADTKRELGDLKAQLADLTERNRVLRRRLATATGQEDDALDNTNA